METNRCSKGIGWSRDTTKDRKKMICGSMVKSVLINGTETWSLGEDDRQEENPRN